ncbi:MAG: hypothetical protein J5725_01340 [Bacteroidales bacterium]|nr:hypothetical protein [Bacteroidales bacterium]
MANKAVTSNIVADIPAKKGTVLGTFSGKCCDAAVFNNNDMKLNRELFEKLLASEEYKDALEHGYYIGFLGHPEDPNCQEFEKGCIVMTSMELKDNDEVYGDFDLIDTPVGRVVKTFTDAGVKFGISIRGAGDVDAEGNVDPDSFIFRGFDLVAFPAYNDAVPEFMEIAAASDPKYKKIKAAIETNLPYITSVSAIEEIQATLNPHSAEYKKLEARKQDIGVKNEEPVDEVSDEELEEITAKKLRCMTDMYIEECEKNKELEATLASTQSELKKVTASYERKIKSLKRITASQNTLMQERLERITANRGCVVKANAQLRGALQDEMAIKSEIISELEAVKSDNLIYKQKIECSSADIKDRDATISGLRKELDKTVVASTNAKRDASNRDEEVKQLRSIVSSSKKTISDLESRIVACEEMLYSYQQAYADFYATALGTSVSELPVTASTSVSELKNLIQGATNTSNLGVMFNYDIEEDDFIGNPVDVVDGEDDNNLATL